MSAACTHRQPDELNGGQWACSLPAEHEPAATPSGHWFGRRQDAPAPRRVIVCGGTPSARDLQTIEEFAAALEQPTDERRRAALLAMSDDGNRS